MASPAPRRARVRAPELIGKGGWLNTGGTELALADLRGRIVILDFWKFTTNHGTSRRQSISVCFPCRYCTPC
ncbi:hypothetical protein E4099_17800 [Streptomyces palmae]|uniref:Redoxin domain-containing protein n=1 Tax=Streptomyces palmae TaxID=1701085 RepID=A0A4Z0H7Q5_9ACTN|nr:hypothetical protein E4099_17800 [Streptomyces palmae]